MHAYLALILFQLNPMEIQIIHPFETNFNGWRFVSGEVDLPFGENGSIRLPAESEPGPIFEVFDSAGRTRFIGQWAQYPKDRAIQLHLSPTNLNLHEVVSGSRSRESSFSVAATIDVIDVSEQLTHAQTSEHLKSQAAVLVQKTNLGGGSPILRGVSGNRVLLNYDGFRINNGTFRLGLNQYLNAVPSGQLEQIEVLQGPSGVQFGSDGLGGTVFMKSANPFDLKHAPLEYVGSASHAEFSQSHQITGNLQKDHWIGSAQVAYRNHGELRAGGDVGVQEPTGFEEWNASLTSTWRFGEHKRLKWFALGSDAENVPRTDRIVSGRDLDWRYEPQEYLMTGFTFEAQWQTQFMDTSEFGVAITRQNEGRRRISSSKPDEQSWERDKVKGTQFFANFHKVHNLGRVDYGLDYAVDRVESYAESTNLNTSETTSEAGKYPPGAGFSTGGLFVNTNWDLKHDFFAIGGLRWSRGTFEGDVVQPIGRVDKSSNAVVPRLVLGQRKSRSFWSLSISEGFRVPSLEDALALGLSNKGLDVPNPELGPEYVRSIDIITRFRLGTSLVQFSAYSADYRDFIDRVPGTYNGQDTFEGEPVFMNANVGGARIDGATASFEWSKDRIGLHSDLAYTYGRQDSGEPTTRTPPLRGNVKGTWYMPWGEQVLHFSFADRQDRLSSGDIADSRIPEDGTPGYGVLHYHLNYKLNDQIGLQAQLVNILDKAYKIHGSGIHEAGRGIRLAIRAKMK